ncbi:DUF2461 domain-containing protein [Egicoccus sp. AB-alg6-2]|uniref:DUF2461 domain-containing protein n=1 Tax=Egicoccus sp. AB-alg6-2 TaxID=3242692 RepID=UPI00359E39C1
MATSLAPFAGFPPEAFAFYAALSDDDHNDRSWFDDNRDVYERAVRIPMESLLARADDDGWGSGKVFRPNRDVRFSNDKRPYKTHCGAVISFRDGTGRASCYAELNATGLRAGCGYWELSRDQLDRFRQAVADARRGGELARIVDRVTAAGIEVTGSALKRAPRGYPADHPNIALLRHTRLAGLRAWPIEPWMHTAAAYDRITGLWRAARPIADWLESHVGAATEPRRPRGG